MTLTAVTGEFKRSYNANTEQFKADGDCCCDKIDRSSIRSDHIRINILLLYRSMHAIDSGVLEQRGNSQDSITLC